MGKLSTRMAHFGATQILEPVALASRDRLIQSIQGTVPKKKRGGKLGENLGKFTVHEVVEPIALAGTEREGGNKWQI